MLRYERFTNLSALKDAPTHKLNPPRGITIHNTEKISVGGAYRSQSDQYAGAQNNGNLGGVFVHYYVDENTITQALFDTQGGYHSGDWSKGRRTVLGHENINGNMDTISIEIIGGSDEATENGVKLAAELLKKHNLTANDLFKHQDWSGKYCPAYILDKARWETFKASVAAELNSIKNAIPTANAPTDAGVIYRVQVGAFALKSNAEAYLKKAKDAGFSDAFVLEVTK